MNHEEHDDLWELLGKARTPVVSPFLARKVVREVRNMEQGSDTQGVMTWLRRFWQIPAMAACAVAIAGGTMAHRESSSGPSPVKSADLAVATVPDFGVIGHLDELIDSEKNSVWLAGDAE